MHRNKRGKPRGDTSADEALARALQEEEHNMLKERKEQEDRDAELARLL